MTMANGDGNGHGLWQRGVGGLALLACAAAAACGGGSTAASKPGAPTSLVASAGDRAIALGWKAPAGGGAVQAYEVSVAPPAGGAVTVAATTALVRGAANGTRYTLSVSARNGAGAGPASAVEATPRAYDAGGEAQLTVAGDSSPSGIFDPSVVFDGATAWMSYSSVDYHLDGQGHRVLDVGLRLARSDDAGASWTYVREVAARGTTAVVADAAGTVCGAATCTGRWNYETSWLVDDPTDASASRYKLYTHQYFLYPPAAASTFYTLGAIVVWTAATPAGLGDALPRTVLRWGLTPASLAGGVNVNGLSPDLAGCLVVTEGAATARPGALDLVLACPYGSGDPLPQKVVLLRSADHGATVRYVSTLLDAPDAAPLGASFYTAPSLLPGPDPAPLLLVTPSVSAIYAGCVVFPFDDLEAGALVRDAGPPVPILGVPLSVGAGMYGGACALDRGLTGPGILRSEVDLSVTWPPTFRILRTGRGL
jgi:hypothetical protein